MTEGDEITVTQHQLEYIGVVAGQVSTWEIFLGDKRQRQHNTTNFTRLSPG